jgi:hypothetical protein
MELDCGRFAAQSRPATRSAHDLVSTEAVTVEWQDEAGGGLASVADARGLLAKALESPALAETRCLRFLDAYGKTVFNQAQIPGLLEELERLLASSGDAPVTDHLRRVIDLVDRARCQTHTYIAFIGD